MVHSDHDPRRVHKTPHPDGPFTEHFGEAKRVVVNGLVKGLSLGLPLKPMLTTWPLESLYLLLGHFSSMTRAMCPVALLYLA